MKHFKILIQIINDETFAFYKEDLKTFVNYTKNQTPEDLIAYFTEKEISINKINIFINTLNKMIGSYSDFLTTNELNQANSYLETLEKYYE